MKKYSAFALAFFILFTTSLTARDILIADFLQQHIGLILGTNDYHVYSYWEDKGSLEIDEKDRSGRTGSDFRKSYDIKDVTEIDSNILKIVYESVNAATTRVTLETNFELGDKLLDEFIRTGARYTPRTEDEGNIAFSGTYNFDDYIVTVTEYKREQKLSFTISMTHSFKNKNQRRR